MNTSQFTVNQLFYNALTKYGERVAIVHQGEEMTYEELRRASNRVGHALKKRGVGANTSVALMMSNCPEYVISLAGLHFAGGTLVPLNDMLGQKEIKYILQDSEAKVAIVGPNLLDHVKEIQSDLPKLETIVVIGDENDCPENMISWKAFQSEESEENLSVQVFPNDLAMIGYTGGTTGLPKGVVHTQQNIAINLYSHIIEIEMQDRERILLMSPLPHSAGFVLQAGILKGATHFIEKGFDPQLVLDRIENEKVTLTFMVPTMIYRVMDQIQDRAYDYSSLQTIMYGAAPITEERLKQGLDIFGSVFIQIYGQTEAPNFVTKLRKSDHIPDGEKAKRLRSCGQPVLMSQVKIVDENGKEVAPGVEGEIITKTPYNMIEYLNQPEKTAETLIDGWIHTGDVGMKDEDGYIYLLDRKKDMIISGGMNVYTTEVENVIQMHPEVSQVAVIGVPDPDWGEVVTAMIVAKPGTKVSEEEILQHCKAHLSKYKNPKKVYIVDTLPLTPYGKIDKKALRKPFWEAAERNI